MTTYGYVRVSTAQQASGGSSLDAQASQIRGYALMRGWTDEVRLVVEAGVSGSVPLSERPAGADMVGRLVAGDAVVVTKLDRMFRSASDALSVLEEVKARGVSIHMLDLGGDVTGNGISKLVFTILAAVADSERERICERIKDVKAHMKSAGLHGGGPRPYGWRVSGHGLIPDADEQRWVTRMKTLSDGGMGTYRIAALVASEGGPSLQAVQVQRILARAKTQVAA